jgi:hypothetical protein
MELFEPPLARFNRKIGLEEDLYNEQKKKIVRNGICDLSNTQQKCKLYYEVYGNGNNHFLMIQGMSGSMDDMKRLLLYLLENVDCSICIYDHRGVRFSESYWKTYSFKISCKYYFFFLILE